MVLADASITYGLADDPWRKEILLAGLLSRDPVECLRYADEGPPKDLPRHQVASMGDVVAGWAELLPSGVAPEVWEVRTGGPNRLSRSGITGNRTQVATQDTRTSVYEDMPAAAAAERRTRDALAGQVAEAVHADIYLTDRPYLHAVTWPLARGMTVLDVDQALPLISLYLRAQGQHLIWRSQDGTATLQLNRGFFYWVGSRELLPSGWRWSHAFAQLSQSTGDDTLLLLSQSVLQRIARALQVRDRVHIALNQPQDNDIAEDALSALDVVLLLLMGAVDATARVVHQVLQISGSAFDAAWQRARWLSKVLKVAPGFAVLIGNSTTGCHALTVLRILRNSVHGATLQSLALKKGTEPLRTLVGIPPAEAKELLAAVAELGGPAAWGIEEILPGRFHADPGVLLERLLPQIFELLNAIMDATPVESLEGVVIDPSHRQPPTIDPYDIRSRLSVRWQLGF